MSDFSKIECTLLNQDGRPQAYLGRANTLRVQLTNQTGQALPLTGGLPADPPPPGGPFTVRLSLAELLADPTAQAALTVAAPGWTARFFADDDYPAWLLSPVAGQCWGERQTLTLTVAGLTPTVKPGTYYADVELHNLDGLPPLARRLTLGVVSPPTQQPLRTAVGAELAGSTVYSTKRHASPVRNELKLTIYNSTDQPLVAPDQPWGPDSPQFILSLVTAPAAPGYYALTTPNALRSIEVSVTGTDWQVEATGGTQVQWLLLPQRHAVLGTGTAGLVEITLRNIVTSFQPGPTLLYVQGLNVPGYADGFLTLLLRKDYQPMRIEYFRLLDPGPVPSGQSRPAATLEWKVSQATDVLLSGVGAVAAEGSCPALPGLSARAYALTAFDTALGRVEERQQTLHADPLLGVPVGSVVAWSGAATQVPPGWLVCDGTRGTPDLRDCFVPGAGDGAATGPHLGERAPRHGHPLAPPAPAVLPHPVGPHTHGLPGGWYLRNLKDGNYTSFDCNSSLGGPFPAAGEHSHTAEVYYDQPLALTLVPVPRPAWYALLYLQYRGLPAQ